MRKFSMALVLVATFAALPAMAQSSGGGGGAGGDNSEVMICRTRLEQEQLRAQAMVDPGRQAELMQNIKVAREALASGNPTKCLTELDKMGR